MHRISIVAGSAVVSGVVAATAVLVWPSQASQEYPAVASLTPFSEVRPGGTSFVSIGDAITVDVDSDTTVPLESIPAGASHLRVTVVSTAPGTLAWGPDAGGNNPSVALSDLDFATESTSSTSMDFELTPEVTTLYFTVSGGHRGQATVQYMHGVTVPYGVNTNGQTYGVESATDRPDLILTVGTGPDGQPVEGYVTRDDMDAFGPDHPSQPSSPEEAIAWQDERDAAHPHGWDVPLYASDGETVIGSAPVGKEISGSELLGTATGHLARRIFRAL